MYLLKKPMRTLPINSAACVCQSGASYLTCCQPLHKGNSAPNAEALMRSRYSAYVLKLEYYLLQTWHPDTRPASLDLDSDVSTKWLGLQVKSFEKISTERATVEFVARYKINGKAERMHEISQFIYMEGRWYYLEAME